tara:strand:- start:734 stop:1015 length:282 start_codon:yes stop_codon:yes gene_type:complete
MDLFDTLATTLYPATITEQISDMSNHYNSDRDERIAESVFEIVDSLSEEAIRRLLEEHLIEEALKDEDFAWEVQYQTSTFIHQAERKAELANA